MDKQGSMMQDHVQGSPEVHVKDFNRIGMNSQNSDGEELLLNEQENEMRETSYFK
jgi:hypothetical protein